MKISDIGGMVRFSLPPPCVYFLLSADEVVYVGSTINLQSRLDAHRRDGKAFDEAFYLPVDGDVLEMEASFIRALRPRYNSETMPTTYTKHDDTVLGILGISRTADRYPVTSVFRKECFRCEAFISWSSNQKQKLLVL